MIAGGIAAAILAGRAHLGAFVVVSVCVGAVVSALFCYAFGMALSWLHAIMVAAEEIAEKED